MRIASFNVENLFSRVRAMNLDEWADGRGILNEYSKLNSLLQKATYTSADKGGIIDGLERLGIDQTNESRWALLRENRGKLVKRPQSGGVEIVANGRADWVGWIELKKEAVNEVSTQMTARIVQDVNADILCLVEAEDRVALTRFDDQLLKPITATYDQIMLIDGNDERGIDVGIMVRHPWHIDAIVSHVDDALNNQRIFSRDCAEYYITHNGTTILVMANHLKSKGYGSPAASNARRLAQATRVRAIYDERRAAGNDLIAIVGDFNDTPESAPLAPLMTTDLRDDSTLPGYVHDLPNRPGTYGNGTASNKIDYILLSPALAGRMTAGGINRLGVWGGKNGDIFPHYPEMTSAVHAASDHAAIYADIDI